MTYISSLSAIRVAATVFDVDQSMETRRSPMQPPIINAQAIAYQDVLLAAGGSTGANPCFRWSIQSVQ